MAQYYSLEEAAQKLGLSTDDFRRRLQTDWKTSPRRYPDGTTLRFQVREIDELARALGGSSDPDLHLGDGPIKLADEDSSDLFIPVQDDDVLSGASSKNGGKSRQPDSDVKLEKADKKGSGKIHAKTEEMNLDVGQKPTTTRKFQAPLEIKSESGSRQPKKDDSSSEFELSLTPDSSDEFDLKLTEDDSDEVDVGVMPGGKGIKGGDSGINLHAPADSGISLEKSSSDFELELESGVSKPKSGPKTGPKTGPKSGPKSAPIPTDDSDSEFELTLDDHAGSAGDVDATAEQKDIFETDFELPTLDEESGSEAVALEDSDTDLESSDFDLALDEGDASSEGEESGSEVVAIPESSKRKKKIASDDEDLDEFEASEAVDDDADVRPAAPAAKASWGVLPGLVLIPTVLVMALVGLMSFELLRSMWGYAAPSKPSGMLVRYLAQQFGDLPKD